MRIRILKRLRNKQPEYITKKSLGMDISATISNEIVLGFMKRTLINTGSYIELPDRYETRIRPRSRLAIKTGYQYVILPIQLMQIIM